MCVPKRFDSDSSVRNGEIAGISLHLEQRQRKRERVRPHAFHWQHEELIHDFVAYKASATAEGVDSTIQREEIELRN